MRKSRKGMRRKREMEIKEGGKTDGRGKLEK